MANSFIIYYISGTGMFYNNNNLISDNESDYCVLIKLGILESKAPDLCLCFAKCLHFFNFARLANERSNQLCGSQKWEKAPRNETIKSQLATLKLEYPALD